MCVFPCRPRRTQQQPAHDRGGKQGGQQQEQFYRGYPGLLLVGEEGGVFRSQQSTADAAHQYQRRHINQLAVK